jgi:hypothetical protein
VRSSLSLPLAAQGRPVGAFNLYSRDAGFFGEAQTRDAERFAQNVAGAVAIAARLAVQAVMTGQLRASLASRAVIDQAIGVLMAEQRCTAWVKPVRTVLPPPGEPDIIEGRRVTGYACHVPRES